MKAPAQAFDAEIEVRKLTLAAGAGDRKARLATKKAAIAKAQHKKARKAARRAKKDAKRAAKEAARAKKALNRAVKRLSASKKKLKLGAPLDALTTTAKTEPVKLSKPRPKRSARKRTSPRRAAADAVTGLAAAPAVGESAAVAEIAPADSQGAAITG